MISSMTGFGEITAEVDGTVYSVEIRTVNNRHLKAYVRLPEKAQFLTEKIEKKLRKEKESQKYLNKFCSYYKLLDWECSKYLRQSSKDKG